MAHPRPFLDLWRRPGTVLVPSPGGNCALILSTISWDAFSANTVNCLLNEHRLVTEKDAWVSNWDIAPAKRRNAGTSSKEGRRCQLASISPFIPGVPTV